MATVAIRQERDVVLARQRARQIAELLGFDRQDQTRIATAISELARNAYQYAGGGEVAYSLERDEKHRAALTIRVTDRGPGIDDIQTILDGGYRSATGMGIGIVGVRRLMDRFELESDAGRGTTVVVGKPLPEAARMGALDAAAIEAEIARGDDDPFAEMQRQNQDLVHTLEEVERRERELERVNKNLAETNRRVVALYAELDERAQAARVLSDVADGIALVGLDGKIRQWNRAAASIVGRTAEQVVGRSAVEAIPGWATFAARIPVTESPTGDAAASEIVPIEIDGRELWLSGAGVALPEGTVYAFRNVTKERTLERVRNEVISTVSHELRTPLASVYGAARTLERQGLSEEIRSSLLAVIVHESKRLERIADSILVASRIQEGKMPVAIEAADLERIVRETVAAVRARLPDDRTIVLTIADSMPAVECDREMLGQVLANLVDNAVRYSPQGGEIEVSVTHGGGLAHCSVRDEGLGIPAEEHERIFERFYRLDPDLRHTIAGTGLGLYISRELVRLMGGRIEVRSQLGKGSTFAVELPLAAEAGVAVFEPA
ncbi:MAG: ATP-binding protein [Gaiellaceae bacterium]